MTARSEFYVLVAGRTVKGPDTRFQGLPGAKIKQESILGKANQGVSHLRDFRAQLRLLLLLGSEKDLSIIYTDIPK